jgi:hypothetical protein
VVWKQAEPTSETPLLVEKIYRIDEVQEKENVLLSHNVL